MFQFESEPVGNVCKKSQLRNRVAKTEVAEPLKKDRTRADRAERAERQATIRCREATTLAAGSEDLLKDLCKAASEKEVTLRGANDEIRRELEATKHRSRLFVEKVGVVASRVIAEKSSENEKLSSDNEKLSSKNEKLSSENEKLSSENEKLSSENEKLSMEVSQLKKTPPPPSYATRMDDDDDDDYDDVHLSDDAIVNALQTGLLLQLFDAF